MISYYKSNQSKLMKPMDDNELVTRLQNFEAEAVDELLERYADRLHNYIYYHSGNHHLAEDIVSETFARIIEKISSYKPGTAPFKSWVYRIAHNLLVDHFRDSNQYRSVSIDSVNWDEKPQARPSSDWGAADGGEMATRIADRDELKQAITLLPEDQRTVFILRFIEGNSLEQVSLMLDKTTASIKSLQYRAVRNLRAILDNNGE